MDTGSSIGFLNLCFSLGSAWAHIPCGRCACLQDIPLTKSAIELPNFRDLASASPGTLSAGKVFRSAAPSSLKHFSQARNAYDTQRFLQSVGVYIDLRSRQERYWDDQDRLATLCGEDFKWRWRKISVLNRRRLFKGLLRSLPFSQAYDLVKTNVTRPVKLRKQLVGRMDEGGLLLLNRILLDAGRKGVRKAMEAVKDSVEDKNGPALIFCSAGKDRTGLVVALVLATAGVSKDDIVADYVASNQTWVNGDFELRQEYSALLEEAGLTPRSWLHSDATVLERTLEHIQREHGSVEAYLSSIGFDEASQAALQDGLRSRNPF